jgi:hypothetical protein
LSYKTAFFEAGNKIYVIWRSNHVFIIGQKVTHYVPGNERRNKIVGLPSVQTAM